MSDEAGRFLADLSAGREPDLVWVRDRVRARAAPRFTRWAWEWIEDDFLSDLLVQLTTTVGGAGFELRGSPAAYVDVSIANLCRSYYRTLAEARRGRSLDDGPDGLPSTAPGAARRVASALELWSLLREAGPRCRRLLLEKYALGLSLEEMAADHGIEAKTVRSRLHSCRERLRAWINKSGSGDSGRGTT